jgi:thioredoxin-dependent peroxiredoxin
VIEIGQVAPDFEAVDSTGGKFRLSSFRGRKVILYFFPKAFSGGCTQETIRFAKAAPALAAKGSQVVGISVDTAETQARFAERCSASFPILADPSKSIARAFGVLSLLGMSKRATFFIDEHGVVRDIVVSLLPGPHLARALEALLP